MNASKITHQIDHTGQVIKVQPYNVSNDKAKTITDEKGNKVSYSKSSQGITIHGLDFQEGRKVSQKGEKEGSFFGQSAQESGSQIPFRGSLAARQEVRTLSSQLLNPKSPSHGLTLSMPTLAPFDSLDMKYPGVYGGGVTVNPNTAVTPMHFRNSLSEERRSEVAPESVGRETKISQEGESFVRIEDWLSTVAVSTTTQPGDVLFSMLLGSGNTSNPKLQVYRSLYLMIQMMKGRFMFKSNRGAFNDGSIAIFIVPDPDFVPPGGAANVHLATNVPCHAFAKVTEDSMVDIEFDKSFYTTLTSVQGSRRWENLGKIFVIATSTFAFNGSIGNLYMDASYKLKEPAIGQSPYGMSALLDTTGKGYVLTAAYPLGTQAYFVPTNPSTLVVGYYGNQKPNGSELYLPPGQYGLIAQVVGTSLGAPTLNGGSKTTFLLNDSMNNAAVNRNLTVAAFKIDGGDPLNQFVRFTFASGTITTCIVLITVTVQYQTPIPPGPLSEIEELRKTVAQLQKAIAPSNNSVIGNHTPEVMIGNHIYQLQPSYPTVSHPTDGPYKSL